MKHKEYTQKDRRIKLLKNNDNRNCSDTEWIQEFSDFLQGVVPEGIECTPLNLTPKQAKIIIWYLQEHFPILPDDIEMCSECNKIYDSRLEGFYSEKEGKFYCDLCYQKK